MKQRAARPSPGSVTDHEAASLGLRLRTLRQRAGLTLDALAEQSAVSKAMLSKLERGESNPTVAVAYRIARALGVSISELAGIEERRPAVLVPAAKRLHFTDPDTGVIRHIFPALQGGALEFMHFTLPPGSSTGDLPAHRTGSETYLVVDRGRLDAQVGSEHFTMSEEDVLYFGGDVPHRFTNPGPDECHCFVIALRNLS